MYRQVHKIMKRQPGLQCRYQPFCHLQNRRNITTTGSSLSMSTSTVFSKPESRIELSFLQRKIGVECQTYVYRQKRTKVSSSLQKFRENKKKINQYLRPNVNNNNNNIDDATGFTLQTQKNSEKLFDAINPHLQEIQLKKLLEEFRSFVVALSSTESANLKSQEITPLRTAFFEKKVNEEEKLDEFLENFLTKTGKKDLQNLNWTKPLLRDYFMGVDLLSQSSPFDSQTMYNTIIWNIETLMDPTYPPNLVFPLENDKSDDNIRMTTSENIDDINNSAILEHYVTILDKKRQYVLEEPLKWKSSSKPISEQSKQKHILSYNNKSDEEKRQDALSLVQFLSISLPRPQFLSLMEMFDDIDKTTNEIKSRHTMKNLYPRVKYKCKFHTPFVVKEIADFLFVDVPLLSMDENETDTSGLITDDSSTTSLGSCTIRSKKKSKKQPTNPSHMIDDSDLQDRFKKYLRKRKRFVRNITDIQHQFAFSERLAYVSQDLKQLQQRKKLSSVTKEEEENDSDMSLEEFIESNSHEENNDKNVIDNGKHILNGSVVDDGQSLLNANQGIGNRRSGNHIAFEAVSLEPSTFYSSSSFSPEDNDDDTDPLSKDSSKYSVFLTNLPIDMTPQELYNYYRKQCGPISSIKIYNKRPELDPGPLSPKKKSSLLKKQRMSFEDSNKRNERSPVYAMIEFSSLEGYKMATHKQLTLFGMVIQKNNIKSIPATSHDNDDVEEGSKRKSSNMCTLHIENIPSGFYSLDLEYKLNQVLKPEIVSEQEEAPDASSDEIDSSSFSSNENEEFVGFTDFDNGSHGNTGNNSSLVNKSVSMSQNNGDHNYFGSQTSNDDINNDSPGLSSILSEDSFASQSSPPSSSFDDKTTFSTKGPHFYVCLDRGVHKYNQTVKSCAIRFPSFEDAMFAYHKLQKHLDIIEISSESSCLGEFDESFLEETKEKDTSQEKEGKKKRKRKNKKKKKKMLEREETEEERDEDEDEESIDHRKINHPCNIQWLPTPDNAVDYWTRKIQLDN